MSSNLDYILFSTASVAAFVALWILLRRYKREARLPMAVWFLALAALAGTWWLADRAAERARWEVENVLQSLAPTYAYELQRMGHEQLTLTTPSDDPRYVAMLEVTRRWQELSLFTYDIYTMRRLPDGKIVFVVDADTDYNRNGKIDGALEQRTPIGTVFDEKDEGLELALKGTPNFNQEIIRDHWGSWVGAWAPIFNQAGQIDAVVGVDFDSRQWTTAISGARRNVFIQMGLVMGLLAMGGAAVALLRADNARSRAAEERSRRAEERMALTLRSMPLAFIEWNTGQQCVGWNPAAERIFGYRPEEMMGRSMGAIVGPNSRDHIEKTWSDLRSEVGGTHSMNHNLTNDGRSIVCEWFNTRLQSAKGEFIGAFSLVQDITERVELEKHVQQVQRLEAVGQLAAGVAHDFNNILTIITGHSGLLLSEPGLGTELRDDVERIQEAAMRASGLTRQLLAFSRQQAVFPRALHVGPVVEDTTQLLSRVLPDDIQFDLRITPDLPPIEVDPAMLSQVITNLLLNARDALPHGGAIQLTVDEREVDATTLRRHADATLGKSVCIRVSDTGIGIPEENLRRLFEPFFTTKQTGQGTGLGLSVVHGIVKQHRGWIDVDSKVGCGSTFTVSFPATNKTPAESAATPPKPEVAAPAAPTTILLAEDEPIVRELACMILERSGYKLIPAEDGVEALRLWAEHRAEIGMLVTDMVMPNGVTGRELAKQILAERPDLPIVYASGYSLELTAPDFRETDVQVFLQKPYLTDQLVSTVRRCLAKQKELKRAAA